MSGRQLKAASSAPSAEQRLASAHDHFEWPRPGPIRAHWRPLWPHRQSWLHRWSQACKRHLVGAIKRLLAKLSHRHLWASFGYLNNDSYWPQSRRPFSLSRSPNKLLPRGSPSSMLATYVFSWITIFALPRRTLVLEQSFAHPRQSPARRPLQWARFSCI